MHATPVILIVISLEISLQCDDKFLLFRESLNESIVSADWSCANVSPINYNFNKQPIVYELQLRQLHKVSIFCDSIYKPSKQGQTDLIFGLYSSVCLCMQEQPLHAWVMIYVILISTHTKTWF